MAELVLELFSEEIPARMQAPMASGLQLQLKQKLDAAGLYSEKVHVYVTPRRLVLSAEGLSATQEGSTEEKRGPRTDAPDAAVEGFCRSAGVPREELVAKQTDKGEFYFAIKNTQSRPTQQVLKEIVQEILENITWPKSMRWADEELRWVRPLHNIACVFSGEVLPISLGHLTANDNSTGHRFLGNDSFAVSGIEQFKKELESRQVILDQEVRKRKIETAATELAKEKGCELLLDEKLLEEVTGLVEYPQALLGKIPEGLMNVPEEVLISSIKTHQKYFVMRDKSGTLAPYFIVISNMPQAEASKNIIAGNERVLRARLSDAVFFWEQDKKVPLEERAAALEGVVFHAKLGTIGDKVKRMTELAKLLDVWVPRADFALTERAGQLAKADLVTEMVGEFPDLQGVMGAYYAAEQGEAPEVAEAIKAHYAPQGPSEAVPSAPVSISVALADKLDTLVGMFAIGELPTGSKDPFALRRAALGIIRIILENGLNMPLRLACEKALRQFPPKLLKERKLKQQELLDQLMEFFIERLKQQLKGENVRHDHIAAVFAAGGEDDMLRITKRVAALQEFLASNDGENLLAAYRRAANILKAEEKKDDKPFKGKVLKGQFIQDEEKALHAQLTSDAAALKAALKDEKFDVAMTILSRLRGPVDAFFDAVIVNDEDEKLRKNRLNLLASFRNQCNAIADFSSIEG